jgi:hypothetical protein
VEVAVHNDGKGVDPVIVAALWTRKRNTLHRLEVAGGAFAIRSRDEASAGVTVTLTWPAADSDERDGIAPFGARVPAPAFGDDTGDDTTP